MKSSTVRYYASLAIAAGTLLALGILVSCGSSSGPGMGNSGTGTVTTNLTDPPTCSMGQGGPFASVWVTITKVTANINADANPGDAGWVTLVDLTGAPKQIDLLSLAQTTCILTQLGSTTGLAPGNYQQIRLYLLANDATGVATPSPNNCSSVSAFNCVALANGPTVALDLSSEAQTGLKIPSGQITGGGINLMAGQSADLNIDFNACASIVTEGNGKFRLKPTLHAGEVSLNQNTITGTVIDSVTKNPVGGAIVLAEQMVSPEDEDNVLAATTTANDGTFSFCGLGAGNYDIVAAALVGGKAYNATITFNVPLGTALSTPTTEIPIVAETGGSTAAATLSGTVSSTTGAAATAADITVLALQSATPMGGSAVLVTVPLFTGSTAFPLTTASGGGCAANTDCASYSLIVPASNPSVGTFNASGTTYAVPAAPPVNYSVEADATTTTSSTTADCTPPTMTVGSIVATAGMTTNVAAINFTACM